MPITRPTTPMIPSRVHPLPDEPPPPLDEAFVLSNGTGPIATLLPTRSKISTLVLVSFARRSTISVRPFYTTTKEEDKKRGLKGLFDEHHGLASKHKPYGSGRGRYLDVYSLLLDIVGWTVDGLE
jgi:hypothetical protein